MPTPAWQLEECAADDSDAFSRCAKAEHGDTSDSMSSSSSRCRAEIRGSARGSDSAHLLQPAHQRERDGGLAHVLPRRRDEDGPVSRHGDGERKACRAR